MAEPSTKNGSTERTKSVRDIFNQSRSIAGRLFNRSAQERVMDTADRYAANIRAYLGNNYSIDTQVPRSVYMGRATNRDGLGETSYVSRADRILDAATRGVQPNLDTPNNRSYEAFLDRERPIAQNIKYATFKDVLDRGDGVDVMRTIEDNGDRVLTASLVWGESLPLRPTTTIRKNELVFHSSKEAAQAYNRKRKK